MDKLEILALLDKHIPESDISYCEDCQDDHGGVNCSCGWESNEYSGDKGSEWHAHIKEVFNVSE